MQNLTLAAIFTLAMVCSVSQANAQDKKLDPAISIDGNIMSRLIPLPRLSGSKLEFLTLTYCAESSKLPKCGLRNQFRIDKSGEFSAIGPKRREPLHGIITPDEARTLDDDLAAIELAWEMNSQSGCRITETEDTHSSTAKGIGTLEQVTFKVESHEPYSVAVKQSASICTEHLPLRFHEAVLHLVAMTRAHVPPSSE